MKQKACTSYNPRNIPKCNDMECWVRFFMMRPQHVAATVNLLKRPDGRQQLTNAMGSKFVKFFDKFRQERKF